MTEYKEIISEAKENTPKLLGSTAYVQGALILIIHKLREMNVQLKTIAGALKHIDSGVI